MKARDGAAVLMALLALGGPASAHSYKQGAIEIGHIHAPPPEKGDLDVYGPLMNTGKTDDALVSVESPMAASARFHKTDDNGETWPGSIDLKPGKPVSMAQWSTHITLSGLKHPLHDGDKIPLTLTFAHAGTIKVFVLVEKDPGH